MSITRVFWSVTPAQTSSPYIRDIANEIEARGCRIEPLSLRAVATTTKEVVHIQWPEHVSRGPSAAVTLAKHARAVGLLAALRMRKHSIVLTAHNRAPHGDSDAVDAWFRRAVQRHAAATILLVPEHQQALESDGAIHANTIVRTIPHPTHPPDEPLDLAPHAERRELVVLGQIHPYHQIEEFVTALEAQGNTRPVLVVGGVGDDELLHSLQTAADRLPWLRVRPGFAADDELEPILSRAAAIVSLQRNTFNSGGPFYALPRNLPIIMSAGAQANDLIDHAGADWVYPVPTRVADLDVAEMHAWLDRERMQPSLEHFTIGAIAVSHIELYELLNP